MFDWIMAIVMIAILALVLGAVAVWRRGEPRRAVLMIIAALVLAGNVAIWSVPAVPVTPAGK